MNSAVSESPFVLPQKERTLRLEFENHSPIKGGTHTVQLKLLRWARKGKTKEVAEVATFTKNGDRVDCLF